MKILQKLVRTIPITLFLSLALLVCAPLARGQTFQYWPLPAGSPNPYAQVIQASDGYFYGTLPGGGANGAGQIFKVDTNGNFTFDLADFGGAYGTQPQGPLMQASDGNFYGTTLLGGGGGGTIFQMNSTNYTLTTLRNFGYADNYLPYGGLTQGRDGLLYGVTFSGGAVYSGYQYNTNGTVYRTDTSGNLTNLVVFTYTNVFFAGTNAQGYAIADGQYPYYVQLVQATNGYFYGTCYGGGSYNLGTVFEMDTNGLVTTLVEFNGANGANPFVGLIQASDGNLYGTTVSGGASGMGTVYQITPGGAFKTLVSFSGGTSGGQWAYSPLMQGSDGLLYGQTEVSGSSGVGMVYAVDFAGNLTRVYSYGTSFPLGGYYPLAGLTQGSDGSIYGIGTYGGANSGGVFIKITPVAPTVVSATCPVTNASQVILVYSESVRANTATNLANYSVNYGGPVVAVTRNSATQVTLQLSSLLSSTNVNILTINNVQSTVGALPIAPATQVTINVPTTTTFAQYNLGGTNDLVVLEAEHYNLNQPNGTRSWVFTTSPALLSPTDANTNYSGDGVMEGDPPNGSSVGATTTIGTAPSSPRLDFLVNFNSTGTNYVWVRGVGNSAPGAANADSVSIGLDGGLTTRIIGFPQGQGYWWTNGQVTTSPSTNIVISTPGLHVINVWIRATGFAIDKLLLTDNSSFVPAGLGPPGPAITYTRSGGNLILSWPGAGILQSSTNVGGIYQDVVPVATSPFTVTLTGPEKFYRIREQ